MWKSKPKSKQYLDNNIEEICRMSKPNSKHFYVFYIDDIDDGDKWFISCSYVQSSDLLIKHNHTITRKDIIHWINVLTNTDGYDFPVFSNNYTIDTI